LVRGSSGRALLLNLDLTHFEQERRFHSPTEAQLRALLADALAGAGIRPAYPLTLASGRLPHVEVVRYRADGVEYLCLLNADDSADVASIPLGRQRAVCDVRSASSRGALDGLTVPLEPKCARLYALAATPWPGLTVDAAPAAERGTTDPSGRRTAASLAFTVGRTGTSPARQLVRVAVTDAVGRLRQTLAQTLWLAEAPVTSRLPLALNDPPGAWRLTVTDVASGATAEAQVDVR
jgi:hypothetical protein